MKDIRNLTDEERKRIFSLMKPIGYKEGDELHTCGFYTQEDGPVELKPVEEE